ncbi:MAG: hypothetical protein XD60_1489 [Acetothermia bacterium 64_32]|nr:MAG: hypothetical protein XD60_1489 [Acetothermia bacterium 64_32]HAF70319.1 hypothetical protein [Candidatus Acetothermia bacterium]
MNDTSPEALQVQLEAIRRLPPEARLRQGLELAFLVRGYGPVIPSIRRIVTIRLVLGDELFRRVYPHVHIRP